MCGLDLRILLLSKVTISAQQNIREESLGKIVGMILKINWGNDVGQY